MISYPCYLLIHRALHPIATMDYMPDPSARCADFTEKQLLCKIESSTILKAIFLFTQDDPQERIARALAINKSFLTRIWRHFAPGVISQSAEQADDTTWRPRSTSEMRWEQMQSNGGSKNNLRWCMLWQPVPLWPVHGHGQKSMTISHLKWGCTIPNKFFLHMRHNIQWQG